MMSKKRLESRPTRVALGLAAAVALTAATIPAHAQNSGVAVTVNGHNLDLNPAPVERAGRIFVPLRGIFENLGASVVYANGTINATGNGRQISLHIGSNQAMVGGNAQTIDTPPFVIGATTYVPLRFVSQALGANVNYDGANRIVAIATGAEQPGQAQPQQPQSQNVAHDVLRDVQPSRDATVTSVRPTISAAFARDVDPNSVQLMLDGLDITSSATRSTTGFVYAPPSPLQSERHRVMARGKLADGTPFQTGWSFSSGTEAAHESLSLSAPQNGAEVGSTFTVSGHTAPNAHVHIVAGATVGNNRFFTFRGGNYAGDTVADERGNFSQEVTLQTVPGASIGLTVTATDPTSNESAQNTVTLQAGH